MEPPPKPVDPIAAQADAPTIPPELNEKMRSTKSVRQLKESLGPLTEEVKVEVEEAMNLLKSLVKSSRRNLYDLLRERVDSHYGSSAKTPVRFMSWQT